MTRNFNGFKSIMMVLTTVMFSTVTNPAIAATIDIQFGTEEEGKAAKAEEGKNVGNVEPGDIGKKIPFGSTGFENGGIHINKSGCVITGFKITIPKGDTFGKISGGKLFTDKPAQDGNTVTFTGGKVPKDGKFWSKMTKSKDGYYTGEVIVEEPCNPPPCKKKLNKQSSTEKLALFTPNPGADDELCVDEIKVEENKPIDSRFEMDILTPVQTPEIIKAK